MVKIEIRSVDSGHVEAVVSNMKEAEHITEAFDMFASIVAWQVMENGELVGAGIHPTKARDHLFDFLTRAQTVEAQRRLKKV